MRIPWQVCNKVIERPLLVATDTVSAMQVTLFPHVASFTAIPTATKQIRAHYDAVMLGDTAFPATALVDRAAGY